MQARLASEGDLARVARQGFSWPLGFQNSEALGKRGRNRSQAGSPLTEEWPGDGASRSPHQTSPRLPTAQCPGDKVSLQELREHRTLGEGIACSDNPPVLCSPRPTRQGTGSAPREAHSPRHGSCDHRKWPPPFPGRGRIRASLPSSAAPLGAGQATTDELPRFLGRGVSREGQGQRWTRLPSSARGADPEVALTMNQHADGRLGSVCQCPPPQD